MGLLQEARSETSYTLCARTLVGRGSTCHLRLDDPFASSEHATVWWTGSQWRVRDLGSRNGTLVDGRRLDPGLEVALEAGAELSFGSGERVWTVRDVGPPGPVARRLDGDASRSSTTEMLALPDDQDPLVTVFRNGDGAWAIEEGDEQRLVSDNDVVLIDGHPWQLFLPDDSDAGATRDHGGPPCTVADLELGFSVSMDEEHVEVCVTLPDGTEHPLPPRSWQFLLLQLARVALEEDADTPPAEAGWVYIDDLIRDLAVKLGTLRLHIHRARQAMEDLGVDDPASIVERRSLTRQVRLGTSRVRVRRLQT